ncbi:MULTISPECIES: hypothetical protein [unclassified Paraflavitalea]|uniref:hypothetical protein n=1 Tax=unclassified Paraflavitalea TaxID=2798305 RepID=UPI003D347469
MKSILFIIISVAFFSCAPKGFISISKQVEKKCVGENGKWKGDSFHILRTKLHNDGKLNFINSVFDTLYILETYEIESGTYTGRIWNGKSVLNYTYNRNTFSFEQQNLFTTYIVKLIQSWDTTAIRKEENINASILPEKYINGTRVFIANTKTQIECIKFKEFFKLERDL